MGRGPPQRIRLCLAPGPQGGRGGEGRRGCDNYRGGRTSPDSGQESDYENCPGAGKLGRLAGEVARLTGGPVEAEVFAALERNHYSVDAAVDDLLSDADGRSGELWGPEGTGARILGNQGLLQKSTQDKLEAIQSKLQNKNLSNKRRKELKKSKGKIAANEKKKGKNEEPGEEEIMINDIQSLTI